MTEIIVSPVICADLKNLHMQYTGAAGAAEAAKAHADGLQNALHQKISLVLMALGADPSWTLNLDKGIIFKKEEEDVSD